MKRTKSNALPPLAVIFLSLLLATGCSSMTLVSTDLLMEQGVTLYQEGRYDDSVLRFEEVLEREPRRYLAYAYMARSLMAQFQWGDALNSARRAFELAPDNDEVMATLARGLLGSGTAALQEGNFGEAISLLSEHVDLEPSSVDGYLGLARAFLRNGSMLQALTAAQKAMQLKPGDNSVLSLLNELQAQ